MNVDLDLNFQTFLAAILVVSIIVVGNFMKDGKTDWLEGALCVLLYLVVALSAWYYPVISEGHDPAEAANGAGEVLEVHRVL